jgi:hypothetical protein
MGAGERLQFLERLHDLEKTIAVLNQRVSRLQHELNRGHVPAGSVLPKGSRLRALFGNWKQSGMAAAMVRQNRRVERHAPSLF